ncbi:TPA: AAA family ATPase [Klebsiella michiganensis]|uniref:AAA family ATPase n=1 Tax=Klebsiella michiganensis TaxID=1134687 RepID=UPI0021FB52EA|nr:AAA family ATPase [Klebsiella michiganensis]MDK9842031.1 AAA family ATPase [Klebsiella michiganensis]UVY41809.1 MAG: AAA domain protein [Bacteriophage sp.]
MKFLNLKVENFMVIADASVDLDSRGLVLVQGINSADSSAASNGAGKSTLMNALMWCLYGETATGYKGDDVLNSTTPKNCRVAVTIEDEGRTYAVIRHRAHKEFKNRLIVRSEDGDLTKGKDTLTQTLVERLIGSSKEVFMASIYASQEAMPDLPGMTDKNLKGIVEEAAGIDRLTKAYAIARDRANAMTARLDRATAQADNAVSLITSTESEIETSSAAVSSWEKTRTERLSAARVYANEMEVKVTEVSMELSDIPLTIKTIENKITDEKKKLSGRTEHDKKVQAANTMVADAAAEIRATEAARDKAVSAAKRAKLNADNVSSSVGKPCSTCGKPYTSDDLSHVHDTHAGEVRKQVDEAKSLTADLAAKKERYDKMVALRDRLVESTPDVSAITERISGLTRELGDVKSRQIEIKAAESALQRANAQVLSISEESNPHNAAVQRHRENLATHKDKLKEIRREIEGMKDQVLLLEKARQVYSPSGVRSHVLTAVTPFLNDKTAEYLSTMSDGNITAVWSTMDTTKKGEIRDKFNIAVEKIGFSKDFRGLSGGEKRKVRLACALALQDMVANRASKSIQLFIGDEIDDALDQAGLERLMGILEAKARERGTVMIVSHKEMKSWFRETVTLEVKEGRSYVV